MFLFRPIQENDFEALKVLAHKAHGLTTLPNDDTILKNKIYESLKAFGPYVTKPSGETYVFVLEDLDTQQLIGTSGIVSKIGGFEPFYTYQIKTELYESKLLNIHRHIKTLHLDIRHNGPSEIFGLFLDTTFRQAGLGKLLSLSRFLFMKNFLNRFETHVISELRGVINTSGKSPFWECVGKHFFNLDFYTADFLSGTLDKQFIKDLMPEYSIYIPLLPHEIQKVIGEVHEHAKPAFKLLNDQGFYFKNEVDIFDAGPTLEAQTKTIDCIQNAKNFLVDVSTELKPTSTARSALIANQKLDFCATQSEVFLLNEETISLSPALAKALKVDAGESVVVYFL